MVKGGGSNRTDPLNAQCSVACCSKSLDFFPTSDHDLNRYNAPSPSSSTEYVQSLDQRGESPRPYRSSSSSRRFASTASLIPKYNHIFTLFSVLLLSTTLSFFSALDAALNCTRGTNVGIFSSWFADIYPIRGNSYYYQQGGNGRILDQDGKDNYNYYNYYNGEEQNANGYYDDRISHAEQCRDLFTSAILPICPLVIILCFIGCRWTKDDNEWKKDTKDDQNIPQTISFSGDEDRDQKRLEEFKHHVHHQLDHFKSCLQILFLSIVCMGLWIYAKISIANESNSPLPKDGDERSMFSLQFQSLGATNYIGEVGQNANLYYSSWISLLVSLALVYELVRISYKQSTLTRNLQVELERISRHNVTQTNAIEVIMTWSKSQQKVIKAKRIAWHDSLYKIRFRTGMWLTTLIACLFLYTSSRRIWNNYIYPNALSSGSIGDDGVVCTIMHGYVSLKSRDGMGLIHPSKCERTKAARMIGVLCMGLSIMALFAHYNMHRLISQEIRSASSLFRNGEDLDDISEKKRKLIPLRVECILACIMSSTLGINALFATAVDGPASKVGDLYYSSWIAFVSSMRLALHCLEDILEEEDDDNDDEPREHSKDESKSKNTSPKRRAFSRLHSINTNFSMKDEVSTRLVMLAPTHSSEKNQEHETIGSYIGGMPIPKKNKFHHMFEERIVEEEEASRAKRVRRWATGCIFSSIYLMSTLDAAFHLSYGKLDNFQLLMVVFSSIFATLSLLMFSMCLNTRTYQFVDNFQFGGIMSILLLFLWVGNLILTLHGESSWAVNEIGEVKTANLYYFTWATVLNAGFLMSSYVKKFLNLEEKPLMIVLWLTIVKICFVMFGSCCDILLTVRDQCQAAAHGDETATFCQRTIAGAIVGLVGMIAGTLAALFRYLHPNPKGLNQIFEALMATVLTILFSLSLALITGIGGPGQSVGDLYYGSWLAFLASLGVAVSLFSEFKNQDGKERNLVCKGSIDDFSTLDGSSLAPYSAMGGRYEERTLV